MTVAWPSFNDNRNYTFNRKSNVNPFSEMVPAEYSSQNWHCGTLELQNISVTKVYLSFMIQKVLPAIKKKLPNKNKKVLV